MVSEKSAGKSGLSRLWLGDKVGRLHPAEKKLLTAACEGRPCVVSETDNIIRASVLRFLVLGGDDDYVLHEHGVDVEGAHIICDNGVFDLSGISADTTLALKKCTIDGAVDLHEARLASVCLSGTKLECLTAPGMDLSGNLLLDSGFFAEGSVDFSNANISGNLACNGGVFSAKERALHAPRVTIGGNVNIGKDCCIEGQVSFQSATLHGDLTFAGGSFEAKGEAINMRNARVAGMLVWRDVQYARGELNLAGAQCLTLNMDKRSWEKPSQIRLDNFTYERFAEFPENANAHFWSEFLARQPERHLTKRFRPSPYQQLAKVLDAMGYEEEARTVRIERKERQRIFARDFEPMPDEPMARFYRRMGNVGRWVLKTFTGHGYRPSKAAFWLVGLIVVGAGIYEYAARAGIMTPTHPLIFKAAIYEGVVGDTPAGKIPIACRENWVHPPDSIAGACSSAVASEYSTFNSIVYSLDTAIPVVNFRMEDDWAPRVVDWQSGQHDNAGWLVRLWEWFQIGAGWALSLLFVSAIGGVIRRE